MTGGFGFVYDRRKNSPTTQQRADRHQPHQRRGDGPVPRLPVGQASRHAELTGSALAAEMVSNFDDYVDYFIGQAEGRQA